MYLTVHYEDETLSKKLISIPSLSTPFKRAYFTIKAPNEGGNNFLSTSKNEYGETILILNEGQAQNPACCPVCPTTATKHRMRMAAHTSWDMPTTHIPYHVPHVHDIVNPLVIAPTIDTEVNPRQTHGCTGLTMFLTFDTRGLFFDSMGISAHGATSMSHVHSRCRDKSLTCLLSTRPSSTR